MAQLALAWPLLQDEHIVPIPGSRRVARVEENTTAADLELTQTDLDQIAEILSAGGHGARYVDTQLPIWN